jgi:hypothetical protein
MGGLFQTKLWSFVGDNSFTLGLFGIAGATIAFATLVVINLPRDYRQEQEVANQTFSLRYADENKAILQGARGSRTVTVGTVVPGLGEVIAIEHHNDRWYVKTSGGTVFIKRAIEMPPVEDERTSSIRLRTLAREMR